MHGAPFATLLWSRLPGFLAFEDGRGSGATTAWFRRVQRRAPFPGREAFGVAWERADAGTAARALPASAVNRHGSGWRRQTVELDSEGSQRKRSPLIRIGRPAAISADGGTSRDSRTLRGAHWTEPHQADDKADGWTLLILRGAKGGRTPCCETRLRSRPPRSGRTLSGRVRWAASSANFSRAGAAKTTESARGGLLNAAFRPQGGWLERAHGAG